GYLGTYSDDRQPALGKLLIEPARQWSKGKYVVAGPQYPDGEIAWPRYVNRIEHLPPSDHRAFYTSQRFALNVTRREMVRAGWSPSVRLFEAAACGVPIISDSWSGLESIFKPGREILIATSTEDVMTALHDLPEDERIAIGARARARVLRDHTAAHPARELEEYVAAVPERSTTRPMRSMPRTLLPLSASQAH